MTRLVISLALLLLVYLLLRRLSQPREVTREGPSVTIDGDSVTEPRPARLEIKNCSFRQIDVDSGPADPDCFYDELFVDFRDPDSGYTFKQSYFVATPTGVAQIMKEERWDHMFGTDLLIVPRFDRRVILAAVLEHEQERHEILPESSEERLI